MKVSVIIPLYNKAPYIHWTLHSVLLQSFRDYEVIVIDDGSSDDGPKVVETYARSESRIRLVRQENTGPAIARNNGLAVASGKYVVFLDADDEWLPEFLQRTVQTLDAAPADVCGVSTGYLQYPLGRSTRAMWERRGLRQGVARLYANTRPLYAVYLMAYMSPWNTLLRADDVRAFGGFCTHGKCLYAEDSFLWTKLLLNRGIYLDLREGACYHTEASGLAINRRKCRPIEPMLQHPNDLRAVCPHDMMPLLDGVLAIRAAKTALMLSYFGKWRQARGLLEEFCPKSSLVTPYVAIAYAAANPAGSAIGWACRRAM